VKYTYAYKTPDGIRHEDSMSASSREEVFASLRARGIKAIKVVASDGSKANGEVRGVRKRVVAAAIVVAAVMAGLVAYWAGRRVPAPPEGRDAPVAPPSAAAVPPPVAYRNAKPLARQAINGDRQRIEAAAASLTNAAERLLAAFAEPGRPPANGKWKTENGKLDEAVWRECLSSPIRVAENEFTEAVDLKRIVAKMKNDLRMYLAAGGDVDGYLEELVRRQKLEVSHREKAERHLARLCAPAPQRKVDKAGAYEYWLRANAQLQSMGIYPLPLPDALRDYEANLDIDE